MSTYVDNILFVTIQCYKCGVAFGMTKEFDDQRNKNKDTFYCPAGHGQVYRESTEEKLRRELERKNQMIDAADARAAKAETERQQVEKSHKIMRARVANGVCPCCNRTFQNLLNHMRTEHPDFNEARTLHSLRTAFGMGQKAVAQEAGVLPGYVSAYERDKYVPDHAKERLDSWVSKYDKAAK